MAWNGFQMDFPLKVLQGLKERKAKANQELQVDTTPDRNLNQLNELVKRCPLGCDPSRTTTAISKSGRRDVGNFVDVYYRGSKLPKEEVPLAVKQVAFWREFDELEERSNRRTASVDRRATHRN
jgi:hypothetical protein